MPSRFDVFPMRTMTKLTLDVETATVEAAKEQERSAKVFAALLGKRVFTVEEDRSLSLSRFVLQAKSMNRFAEGPSAVIEAYDCLYNRYGSPDEALPTVDMSVNRVSRDGRYGMHVALRWPRADPEQAAVFATTQMRRFARTLTLHSDQPRDLLEDLVYAQASRSTGAVFQTNPMGSCSIESDHQDYTGIDVVDLWQHNLYNSEQQLICLVGAVAFANADLHLEQDKQT